MKKTTLFKLIKKALFEVFREDKIKISRKLLGKLNENLNQRERAELLKFLQRKDRSPLLEQVSDDRAKRIYSFLVQNSEEEVPLSDIAKVPFKITGKFILGGMTSDF